MLYLDRATLARLRNNHRVVALVTIQEFHPVHHPRIEAAADVAHDFFDDVATVTQPRQLRPCGREPYRFFTFFTLIADVHAH